MFSSTNRNVKHRTFSNRKIQRIILRSPRSRVARMKLYDVPRTSQEAKDKEESTLPHEIHFRNCCFPYIHNEHTKRFARVHLRWLFPALRGNIHLNILKEAITTMYFQCLIRQKYFYQNIEHTQIEQYSYLFLYAYLLFSYLTHATLHEIAKPVQKIRLHDC